MLEARSEIDELRRQVGKLKKINAALISRVERSIDQQYNAFSLFETAIALDSRVRLRTGELQNAMGLIEVARRQAEAASSLKSVFITSVSHDLLQPLNAAHLALSALEEIEMPANGRALAEQVDRALGTLEELIRTLLDLSRLDAGVLKPEIRSFPLRVVVEPLAREFAHFTAKRGLKLRFLTPHFVVKSDPLMLRRILQNLLANALRYTRRGSVLLGARLRGGQVLIQVYDTGPGIAEDQRDSIFQEFQRAPGSAEIARGFGLGLAIVRRFSQALDHPLGLSTIVGKGSVFSVTAPLGALDDPTLKSISHFEPSGWRSRVRGAKILLIENEIAVSDAMVAVLEQWGCDVAVASSGGEATMLLKSLCCRPDVIIADLHLNSGERGPHVIEEVRRSVGERVPAMLVTADHSADAEKEAADHQLAILKKPIQPSQLRSLLSFMLQ